MFGVNAWSILVPQALEGVAAVGVLYAAVKRWFGAPAGLLAGAVLALTPVAALMFRFNNPDALLVLLLVGAAYAVTRAIDGGRSTAWLALSGALVGIGFITKMLQAFIIVPVLALAYLIAGTPKLAKRLWQLAIAGVALVVSSFWWVVAVMAIPAADRPYIGGSQNNSLWNLIFGYNGFGRLTGNETGSVGGGGTTTGTGQWGPTGFTRLFNSSFGGEISWLLPAALVLLAAGLLVTIRARRTDRTRAALIIWGGWLVLTGLVFSLSKGIIHPYYTVALAPAIGATVAIGGAALWQRRAHWAARLTLASAVALASAWSYVLLRRTPAWLPVAAHDGARRRSRPCSSDRGVVAPAGSRRRRRSAAGAIVVSLAGPTAYTLATVTTTHSGAIPSAGPAGAGGGFGGPGGGGAGGRPALGTRTGTFPTGGFGGPPGATTGAGATGSASTGTGTTGSPSTGTGAAAPGGFGGPGGAGGANIGGLLNGSTPSAALTSALDADASSYTWVAAAIGSNEAAGYQLATGHSVMPIGGFNGTDPSPDARPVREARRRTQDPLLHRRWWVRRWPGWRAARRPRAPITSWVESHFTSRTVGGVTLYDLTSSVSSAS